MDDTGVWSDEESCFTQDKEPDYNYGVTFPFVLEKPDWSMTDDHQDLTAKVAELCAEFINLHNLLEDHSVHYPEDDDEYSKILQEHGEVVYVDDSETLKYNKYEIPAPQKYEKRTRLSPRNDNYWYNEQVEANAMYKGTDNADNLSLVSSETCERNEFAEYWSGGDLEYYTVKKYRLEYKDGNNFDFPLGCLIYFASDPINDPSGIYEHYQQDCYTRKGKLRLYWDVLKFSRVAPTHANLEILHKKIKIAKQCLHHEKYRKLVLADITSRKTM